MARIYGKRRRQVQAARRRWTTARTVPEYLVAVNLVAGIRRPSAARYAGQVCMYMWMDERIGRR